VVTIARMGLAQRETIAALHLLHEASLTDSLTGLRNRRALIERLAEPRNEPLVLAIFDLDGFKAYNDRFGHVRGDALLARLSRRLADAVGAGRAFRLGGDEFCVLAPTTGIDGDALLAVASAALAENAGGIAISSSYGAAALDAGDGDPGHALQLADQRMYAQKNAKRMGAAYAGLLETLYARTPGLRQRTAQVTEIALAAGAKLGMDDNALRELRRAVELRDLGLVAIPDGVLAASEPLTQHGRRAVRDHSETAARMIIGAAPELATVARVVRACAERYDGTGRPGGLADGAIPLAARVIAAAEELVLARQLGDRTAAAAYSSIHALAGSALDPAVVRAVGSAVGAAPADAGTTGGG
jgi:diguanylate cyclase (GGDEF)-like protein